MKISHSSSVRYIDSPFPAERRDKRLLFSEPPAIQVFIKTRRFGMAGLRLLIGETEAESLSSIIQGIEDVAQSNSLLLQICREGFTSVLGAKSGAGFERLTDALLLVGPGETARGSVIMIGGPSDMPGVINIRVDHERAASLALGHLQSLGHSRIAFLVKGGRSSANDPRWEGICFAARRLGLAIRPEQVVASGADLSSSEAWRLAVRGFLAQTRDFTAMYCWNDLAAIGAVAALNEVGLECPRDVSVVGSGQLDQTAGGSSILTTTRGPLRRMGSLAAQTLLMKIKYPQMKHSTSIVLQPELILRSSTGRAMPQKKRAV